MAFSASFTIKAVDQFSAISKTIAKNARAMKKAIDSLNASAQSNTNNYKTMNYGLRQTAQDMQKATAAAKKYGAELRNIKPAKGGVTGGFGPSGKGGKGGIGAALGGIGGTIAGAAGAFLGASGAQSFLSFATRVQDAQAELSSITGATGQDLQFLTDQAFALGKEFGFAGDEMLKTFQVIGSKRPELLKDKKALVEMAKVATTLQVAAGVDSTTAAGAVATSLNVFGGGNKEGMQYANIMAEGTLKGSAEIPQVIEAIKLGGPAAKAANLSFAQTNALIQSMARSGIEGSMAGTAMNAMLMRLRARGLDFKKLGLAGAFNKLSDASAKLKTDQERAEFSAYYFGVEQAKVGEALMANTGYLGEMEKSLDGTTAAQDMMAIKSATLSTQWEKMKSGIGAQMFAGFTEAQPALQMLMDSMSGLFGQDASGLKDVISGLITLASLSLTGLIEVFKSIGIAMGQTAGLVGQQIGTMSDMATGKISMLEGNAKMRRNQENYQSERNAVNGKIDINVNQEGKVTDVKTSGANFDAGKNMSTFRQRGYR